MYTNPILDDNFPDPTIIRASDAWYYAYGTQTKRAGRIINLQIARSWIWRTGNTSAKAYPKNPSGPS